MPKVTVQKSMSAVCSGCSHATEVGHNSNRGNAKGQSYRTADAVRARAGRFWYEADKET